MCSFSYSFFRELHKEIIRLRDISGISSDCELTEVLRELAEIMIHGEKQSDSYFEYVSVVVFLWIESYHCV